jgi:peroxiredoxin
MKKMNTARKLVTHCSAFLLATALAVPLLAGCDDSGAKSAVDAKGGAPAAGKAGETAADFTGRDLNGKTVRLSDYLGKKAVLINFWATYCEPCLAEFPHIRKIYADNKDKGFVVLAVSMDGPETIAQVARFVQSNRLDFPIVLDEDSAIASIYNPKKSAPLSVLIDKSGKVQHVREGYNPGDEVELEKEVQGLIK